MTRREFEAVSTKIAEKAEEKLHTRDSWGQTRADVARRAAALPSDGGWFPTVGQLYTSEKARRFVWAIRFQTGEAHSESLEYGARYVNVVRAS